MELSYKSVKELLISIFVGFSIGLSVIIPGISGSSIAIIMKVYDKLMYSFSNIFKKFKSCIIFLIPIGIGILLGFLIGLIIVKILLEAFPFITICFFVGLMVGTYPILFKEIKGNLFDLKKTLLFISGIIVPIVITVLSLVIGIDNSLAGLNLGHYMLFLVLGILISLTQLIPGLSATVLLMMFGYYKALMDGIGRELFSNFGLIMVYVILLVGFVIGTLLFSKIINKLLENARIKFFFVICGLSIGSVFAVFLGNDCMDIYKGWTNATMVSDILIGFAVLLVGFAISFALYIYDKKRESLGKNDIQK
jgi:putative membrane protein